jgi:hypothetical protein
MKAVVYRHYGGPEVVEYTEVPEAMNRAVDGAAGDRPVIADYCQRLSARPAYRRAIAKGGPTLRPPPPAAKAATDFQPVQGEHE